MGVPGLAGAPLLGRPHLLIKRATVSVGALRAFWKNAGVIQLARTVNHGDPHSVPLTSHWGVIPRLRCCWLSAKIALFVLASGLHPHSWLAQQLHSAAVSALIISDRSHCVRLEQAVPNRSRSLHWSVQ